jgi:hypothetical protein
LPLALARWTDFGAGFRRGARWFVTAEPRNMRFQGRSTALLPRFTFNRSFAFRKCVSDAMTRAPARWLRTYPFALSASRQKRCPLRSSSLSKSSSRMVDKRGESGDPWGIPASR